MREIGIASCPNAGLIKARTNAIAHPRLNSILDPREITQSPITKRYSRLFRPQNRINRRCLCLSTTCLPCRIPTKVGHAEARRRRINSVKERGSHGALRSQPSTVFPFFLPPFSLKLARLPALTHVLPLISTFRFAHPCRSRPRGSIRSLLPRSQPLVRLGTLLCRSSRSLHFSFFLLTFLERRVGKVTTVLPGSCSTRLTRSELRESNTIQEENNAYLQNCSC